MPSRTFATLALSVVMMPYWQAPQQEPSTPPSDPATDSSEEAKPVPASPPQRDGKVVETTPGEAWEILDHAAKSDKAGDRVLAIRVLGLIPNNSRARKLAEHALKDEKPDVRMAAAAALGDMGAKTSAPELKKALEDEDPAVVLAAAHALNQLKDADAYDVYYEVLTGERKASKGLLASQTSMLKDPKKLAQLGFEEGIGFIPFASIGWTAIKTVTKDDTSRVRAAAAKVLADDPDPDSMKALADAALDKSWLVRVAALESLSKRGDPKAISTVILEMYDEKDAVRYTASAAFLRLTDVKKSVVRNRAQVNKHVRPKN